MQILKQSLKPNTCTEGTYSKQKCRKLHNRKLRNVSCLLNVVRLDKSRGLQWAGHVTNMQKTRYVHEILVKGPVQKWSH